MHCFVSATCTGKFWGLICATKCINAICRICVSLRELRTLHTAQLSFHLVHFINTAETALTVPFKKEDALHKSCVKA